MLSSKGRLAWCHRSKDAKDIQKHQQAFFDQQRANDERFREVLQRSEFARLESKLRHLELKLEEIRSLEMSRKAVCDSFVAAVLKREHERTVADLSNLRKGRRREETLDQSLPSLVDNETTAQ
jgi:hypothetical protein